MTGAQLERIAELPRERWASELAKRCSDAASVQQALLWLHASASEDDGESRPTLDPRYELATRLDAGATSTVWQAYDTKLGRDVAIKCFDRLPDDRDGSLPRVLAEARAASDVISDHVVRIVDVHDEGDPYIVMELVGEHDPSCGRLVLGAAASAGRPRDVDEVVRWVMQVARGVHDAHLRNVFHRDLKPDNVLITPLSRRARIADFGLAVSAGTAGLVHRGARGPCSVSGTPEYMAPEQARGLPPLDPRIVEDRACLVAIDVWGLGALAYHLLAGAPPWCATADREAWEHAASGARPRTLARTPWGERVPRRLRQIVERALASSPGERYPTALALADELCAFAERRPTSFDRRRPARVGLWCRRNPQLALAAVVALGLVALTFGARLTVERLRAERDALDHEVALRESSLERLNRNVEQTRRELARTKLRLEQEGRELESVEGLLAKERATHHTLQRELAAAVATTRELTQQLDIARAAAADEQSVHERELAAIRDGIAKVHEERDRLRAERERLRRQRDDALAELDGARRTIVREHAPELREAADREGQGTPH